MPRKRRILIITMISIVLLIAIIGILGYLYLKTDMFKSKETLFAKYLLQNGENVQFLNVQNDEKINKILENRKYESTLDAKVEYTEDAGTSNENKDNGINNVKLVINSNVDNSSDYNYKDISIQDENKNTLVGVEYLKDEKLYGLRLNDIAQFVSIEYDKDENKEETEDNEIYNKINEFSNLDLNEIFELTETEKIALQNRYIGILRSNVSKERYAKQTNAIITLNNKDVKTNAYSIRLTTEEYNNLRIKILEQLSSDEIILEKINKLEEKVKEFDEDYEESFQDKFVSYLEDVIKKIQDNNIGNEEVKITVYENGMKTVRTSIEKNTEKLIVDMYNNSTIKVDSVKLGDTTLEKIFKIEKINDNNELQYNVNYTTLSNSDVLSDMKFSYKHSNDEKELKQKAIIEVANEANKATLTINNDIKYVNEFGNQVLFEDKNVRYDQIEGQQKEIIDQILLENVQNQLSKLFNVVNLDDCLNMLRKLQVVKQESTEIVNNGEVTELEKNRFNSQYEFFVSENLTSDNLKEMIKSLQNNFEDMRILTKDGNLEELNKEMIEKDSSESRKYKENISEIVFYIKRDSKNEDKQELSNEFVDKNRNNKYNVSIQYDENGLARILRAKIQEN